MTVDIDTTVADLEQRFGDWLAGAGSEADALEALLSATKARAAGLWRRTDTSVRLVGFRAVPDMPREVSDGFAEAMADAPLSATDLACVADALHPQKLDVAHFGVSRAFDLRAHSPDEFVYVEDLVTVTKELVHYFCF